MAKRGPLEIRSWRLYSGVFRLKFRFLSTQHDDQSIGGMVDQVLRSPDFLNALPQERRILRRGGYAMKHLIFLLEERAGREGSLVRIACQQFRANDGWLVNGN